MWDFGDGVIRTEDNYHTTHEYSASRYYTLKLTITLKDGTPLTSEQGVFVGPGTRYIQGHTIYGDEIWYSGGTYVIQGRIMVAQGGRLTIEPGAIVKFNKMANGSLMGISVQGTLIADGTTDQPIVFTSVNDNSVEGATGDGTPAAGDWDAINFKSESANSVLRHVVVKYVGYTGSYNYGSGYDNNAGAIQVYSSSVSIANSEINTNKTGVYIKGASPTILASNILNNTGQGIYLDGAGPSIRDSIIKSNTQEGIKCINGSLPTVEGNTFDGNLNYGLFNNDVTVIVNAQQNDWGDPSGPYDPSDDCASGGWYNPSGLGDKVSDHVNYTPWEGEGWAVEIKGDVNGDTVVNLADAIVVLHILSGIQIQFAVNPGADVDGDGKITMAEELFILQKISGLR